VQQHAREVAGAELTGAKYASPSSKSAPGTRSSAIEPEYVYGEQFATRTNAARPAPAISSCSSKRPRRSRSAAAATFANARSPGLRPSGLRPSSSTRRTSSASSPSPALKPKRRPFTRPSPILLVRPAATRLAAAIGSLGRPSARGKTLVPPPGRKPSGTSARSPFTTSLYVPSPPRT
jgi:hypothetical protein